MWGKKEERARFCLFTQGFLSALVMGLFVIGKEEEEEEEEEEKRAQSKEAHARREPIISSSYPHRLLSLDRLASFLPPPFLPRISRWE
jgi:hypothetical protein